MTSDATRQDFEPHTHLHWVARVTCFITPPPNEFFAQAALLQKPVEKHHVPKALGPEIASISTFTALTRDSLRRYSISRDTPAGLSRHRMALMLFAILRTR
jgi:hypothetical protein